MFVSFRLYSSLSRFGAKNEEVGARGSPLGRLFVSLYLSSELVQLYTKGEHVVSAQVSLFPLPPTSSLLLWRSRSASWEQTSGVSSWGAVWYASGLLPHGWHCMSLLLCVWLVQSGSGSAFKMVHLTVRNMRNVSANQLFKERWSWLSLLFFPFLFLSIAPPFFFSCFFLGKALLPPPPNNTRWNPKPFLWAPGSDHLSHPVCRLSEVPLHRLRRGAETWSWAAVLQGSRVGGLLLNQVKGQLSELQPWS